MRGWNGVGCCGMARSRFIHLILFLPNSISSKHYPFRTESPVCHVQACAIDELPVVEKFLRRRPITTMILSSGLVGVSALRLRGAMFRSCRLRVTFVPKPNSGASVSLSSLSSTAQPRRRTLQRPSSRVVRAGTAGTQPRRTFHRRPGDLR